jgi:Ulp1 family protease
LQGWNGYQSAKDLCIALQKKTSESFDAEADEKAAELLKIIAVPLKILQKMADCILIELGDLKFTVREMRLLNRKNWLSDAICDAYFKLVQKRSFLGFHPPQCRKISILVVGLTIGTVFVTRHKDIVSDDCDQWVDQWVKGIGCFLDVDKVLIPMCPRQNHYVLVVVNNIMKRFEFYNSWTDDDYDYQPMFKCIRSFMGRQISENADQDNVPNWHQLNFEWFCPKPVLGRVAEDGKEIPGQGNLSDCGVFMCMFGNYVAQGIPIDFTQEHIPFLRREMLYHLLHGSLQWGGLN